MGPAAGFVGAAGSRCDNESERTAVHLDICCGYVEILPPGKALPKRGGALSAHTAKADPLCVRARCALGCESHNPADVRLRGSLRVWQDCLRSARESKRCGR